MPAFDLMWKLMRHFFFLREAKFRRQKKRKKKNYLLLAEFEGRTVSHGPSFSPSIYGPSVKRARHKLKGKKRGSITCGTDRENEVSKIFIISLLCV